MSDVHIVRLASRQFNRFSRAQVLAAGISDAGIKRRLASGRWVRIHDGVFGVAPVMPDIWGRWQGAVLTSPDTWLSHVHAAAGWGFWSYGLPRFVTVTRIGSGGTLIADGLRIHRSITAVDHITTLNGVPITSPERTLIDIAPHVRVARLARSVREATRLERTTIVAVFDALAAHRGRRGTRKLAGVCARYLGLPIEDARSGAEVRAMEILRDAGRPLPRLNRVVADEEADLVWPSLKHIVEIDGGPFHMDVGEDARKEACWRSAGWRVDRIPSDDIEDHPERLLALAPMREGS